MSDPRQEAYEFEQALDRAYCSLMITEVERNAALRKYAEEHPDAFRPELCLWVCVKCKSRHWRHEECKPK